MRIRFLSIVSNSSSIENVNDLSILKLLEMENVDISELEKLDNVILDLLSPEYSRDSDCEIGDPPAHCVVLNFVFTNLNEDEYDFDEGSPSISKHRSGILKTFKKYNLFHEIFDRWKWAESLINNSDRGEIILHSIYLCDAKVEIYQELTSEDIYKDWYLPRLSVDRERDEFSIKIIKRITHQMKFD